MFGFLATLSGCNCARCNKPDELFGFWLRRPPVKLRRVGVPPRDSGRAQEQLFGLRGFWPVVCGPQLWPGRFHLESHSG